MLRVNNLWSESSFFRFFCSSSLLFCFFRPSLFKLFLFFKSHFLEVETFTLDALVDVRVARERLVAFFGAFPDSDKEADVKVDCLTHKRLNLFSLLVSNCIDAVENHPESHLVAVSFAEGRTSLFVETYVGLPCTKHSHVSECDAKQSVIGSRRYSAF